MERPPSEKLVRHQANGPAFGALKDLPAEVARRVTQMRSEAPMVLKWEASGRPRATFRDHVQRDAGLMRIASPTTRLSRHKAEPAQATEDMPPAASSDTWFAHAGGQSTGCYNRA